MKATIKEDAVILIPNKEHKNFTETDEILPAGTIVEGNTKDIIGLRRGKPFTYKLFVTTNNRIIYLKKIEPMNTEVKLGADAQVAPTTINVAADTNKYHKPVIIGVVIGLAAGYGYSKYKKVNGTKAALYTIVAGVAGYIIGKQIQKKNAVKVTPSK